RRRRPVWLTHRMMLGRRITSISLMPIRLPRFGRPIVHAFPRRLRRAARGLTLMVVLVLSGVAAAADVVAPEPFFQHASYREMRLSPSGKYLGALVPAGGRVRIAVMDVDTKSLTVAGALQDDDIDWFEWVNDDRLVFSAIDLQSGLGEQRGGGLFAVNRNGKDFRILAPTVKGQANRNQLVYRYAQLLSLLRDGTDDTVVTAN